MKIRKHVICAALGTIFLSSCGLWDSQKSDAPAESVSIKDTKGSVSGTRKVETEVRGEELVIDGTTEIKPGLSKDFPEDFPKYPDGRIFQNSNMRGYAFVISEEPDIQKIKSHYASELKKAGWQDVTAGDDALKKISWHAEFEKTLGWKKNRAVLDVRPEVPEILARSLKLTGTYVEIQITK